jgi:hypothetical protein
MGLMEGRLSVVQTKGRYPILKQTGHDWGKDPQLLWHNDHYAIVKWPGSMGWAARGLTSYSPTYYWLLEVEFQNQGTVMLAKKTIREEIPGKNWRKCVDSLLASAVKLGG